MYQEDVSVPPKPALAWSWREGAAVWIVLPVCYIQHPHLNCPECEAKWSHLVAVFSLCGRLDSSSACCRPLQRKEMRFVYFRPCPCTQAAGECNARQWRGLANSALSGNGIEDWPHSESKISPPLENKSILQRHLTAMTGCCWAEHQLIFPLFLFAQHWNLAWVGSSADERPASDPTSSSPPHRLSGKSGGLVVVSWLH